MRLDKLLPRIYSTVTATHSLKDMENLMYMCKEAMKTDDTLTLGRDYLIKLSDYIESIMPTYSDPVALYKMHRRVCFAGARESFLLYLLAMEWNRKPSAKFYPPRKKVLRKVVDALQRLADGKTKLLAISLPPGAGKTTIAIFYLTWMAGRIPDKPMLTGSHSNSFVRGVYDECLRMFDESGDYLWHEIFPEVQVSGTNAKDCRIDLGKPKRFETLEFTSIGTGNAGLYRAATLLYCDDLVSGIEVALSKERLDKLWEIYTTDLRQRKIGDSCSELHIATRWSVGDIIGRLEMEYGGCEDSEFIVIPALDENDESNFDYSYGVGFSTKAYHEQREIMDEVSWKALYMNQPIEREGLVYPADELRRYFDLPEGDPDAIIGVCDTKDKGTDYAFLPVGYQYGENFYIHDCVCDNGLPDIVDARLTEVLLRNKVQQCRFESNSAGGRVAQKIQEDVKAKGGVTHITTKFTTANKETKIIVNSSWVKEHCLFKDESLYKKQSDYGKMMNFLTSYTMAGKNKTDDVPDGMAMFALFAQGFGMASVNIIRRPF